MMKHTKKILSVVLALVMVLSLTPLGVLAATNGKFAYSGGTSGTSGTTGTKPADGTTAGNPFVKGTGGSNSFRIPAMVTLNDGTIVAAADARWNTTYDGGGLDTIVSYSTDNGANWTYTFANYLGDNGNTYNGSGSTAFIDPALATDGETVYMLCDLYPYGVALNGSGNTAPSTAVGFNTDGTLKLAASGSSTYNYYLKDGQIYDSSNNAVSGYTVDAYFNITGNGYNTNLFFSDSPYQVVRTGYLYLTKSTDGGKTWSEPTLIPNVKTSSEQVCLVGPGRGLVTGNTIIFPVYSYNGSSTSQQMGFIYSKDGGNTWTRSANFTGDSWSSESAVVELDDGTLRFFYRNGNSKLYYADYAWGIGWGSAVNTGIDTNSNTQISAISLQNTVGGKQVILVSCPTGSNNAGSADSSASARLNGRIQIGLVDSNHTISWQTPIDVTTGNSQFMYSCLTALTDSEGNQTGEIAILYEDCESNWGYGNTSYYTMSYATYDLGLTFDTDVNENIYSDSGTGITINFGTTDYPADAIAISQKNNVSALSDKEYVAYDISVMDFSGTAEVTIPLNGAFADDAQLHAVYINDSDEIAETISGTYDAEMDTFTFKVSHFSTYAVLADDETSSSGVTATENITLTVGESQTVTDKTGNYENSYTGAGLNASIATVTVTGTTVEGGATATKATITSGQTYLISDGNGNYLTLDGTTITNSTDPNTATQWTITVSGSSYTIKSGNSTLSIYNSGYTPNVTNTTYTTWYYDDNGFKDPWGYSYYLYYSDGWKVGSTSSGYGAAYTLESTESVNATTIEITGVSAGTTSVVVGYTQYNITVNPLEQDVTLAVDGTQSFPVTGTVTPNQLTAVNNSGIVTVQNDGTSLTFTGVANGGPSTFLLGNTNYTITVKEIPPVVDMETTPFVGGANKAGTADASSNGQKVTKLTTSVGKIFDLDLNTTSSNVVWSSADSSIATVDPNGQVTGVTAGETTVTATIDGVAYTIPVVIRYNETYYSNGAYDYICDFYIAEITSTTVTYSINVETTLLEAQEGEVIYLGFDYPFCINFFGMEDKGYALTYMASTNSDNQYYPLYEVDSLNDLEVYSGSSSKSAIYYQRTEVAAWADPVVTLLNQVIEAGYHGTMGWTRSQNNGNITSSLTFRSEKLPTVTKEVTSVNGADYTEGMIAEVGDKVVFTITVTQYAADYDIAYTEVSLKDNLPGATFVGSTSNTKTITDLSSTALSSDTTYTYQVEYVITDDDLNRTITNTVDLTYTYSSTYSSGSFSESASAEAAISAVNYNPPDAVIDFGLPVTFDFSAVPELEKFELAVADVGTVPVDNTVTYDSYLKHGTVTVNADTKTVTYTPGKDFATCDYDVVRFYNTKGGVYSFAVTPATTVYYEEGFATYTGDWTDTGSMGDGTQAVQVAGQSTDEYGYDGKYAAESTGPSNSTQATSSAAGAKATFTFNGTGVAVYTNNNADTGNIMAVLYHVDEATGNATLYKWFLVATAVKDGTTSATVGQAVDNAYNVPIIVLTDLTYGSYKLELTNVKKNAAGDVGTINIDGFRVYGQLATEPGFYTDDQEDDPTFIELRDKVLTGLTVSNVLNTTEEDKKSQYADQIAIDTISQVYATDSPTEGAVILNTNNTFGTDTDVQDLLDNGPKNEIYLYQNQSLVFNVDTSREVQIGLKALNAATTYTINNESKSISTSTDMFYTVFNKTADAATERTITITNTGAGILSITQLKICDDPNASLGTLTAEDLIPALVSLGFEQEKEVTTADATLTVQVNDASAVLTKNGVVGENAVFTAAEIQSAAEGLIPDGYELKDVSYCDSTVAYGESDTVSFTATEKQQEVTNGESIESDRDSRLANILAVIQNLFKLLFGR